MGWPWPHEYTSPALYPVRSWYLASLAAATVRSKLPGDHARGWWHWLLPKISRHRGRISLHLQELRLISLLPRCERVAAFRCLWTPLGPPHLAGWVGLRLAIKPKPQETVTAHAALDPFGSLCFRGPGKARNSNETRVLTQFRGLGGPPRRTGSRRNLCSGPGAAAM